MAGIFDGLGKAEVFEKGSFLNPGYYVVAVQRVMAKKSRESGVGVIGELDILQSTFRPQVDPKNQGRTWQNTPAGVPGTWWQGMEIDGALGSIKGFMRAMLGLRVASHPNECAELESYPPGLVDRYGRPVNMGENLMNMVVSQENVHSVGSWSTWSVSSSRRRSGESDFTVYHWSLLDFASFGVPPPPDSGCSSDRARSTYFPPPDTDRREQPPALPPGGYGGAPGYGQAPAPPWGQPAALPPQGAPYAPPGYGNGPSAPAWRSGPAVPQAWGPPPPAALPPVPPPWTPAPGASLSQDGCWFSYPGGRVAENPRPVIPMIRLTLDSGDGPDQARRAIPGSVVCLLSNPGERQELVYWTNVPEFIRLRSSGTPEILIVGHSIAFDMGVLLEQDPSLWPLIRDAYNANRITDTEIRAKLLDIAGGTRKFFDDGEGPEKSTYSLESLAERFLGRKLDKNTWRLRYGGASTLSPAHLAGGGLGYIPWRMSGQRMTSTKIQETQDPRYLQDQFRQARAAFWIRLMSAWGIHTDAQGIKELARRTEQEYRAIARDMKAAGLLREDRTVRRRTGSRGDCPRGQGTRRQPMHGSNPRTLD